MRWAGLPAPEHVPNDPRVPGADEAMLARLTKRARCSFEGFVTERDVEKLIEFSAPGLDEHIERAGDWRPRGWSNSGGSYAAPMTPASGSPGRPRTPAPRDVTSFRGRPGSTALWWLSQARSVLGSPATALRRARRASCRRRTTGDAAGPSRPSPRPESRSSARGSRIADRQPAARHRSART